MANLTEILEPIANWFSSLGVPEPIVHLGHPTMMAIMKDRWFVGSRQW